MSFEYIPIDIFKFCNLLKEKDIISIRIEDLFNIISDKFCIYNLKKGKRKGQLCLNKTKNNKDNICKKHKQPKSGVTKERNRKKEIIYKCIGINKIGLSCKRNVSIENSYCIYHTNLPKEKKNKKYYESQILNKYRNMNCIEYLKRYNFNITSVSQNYVRIKNEKYNFMIKNNHFYDNNTTKNGKGLLNLIMFIYNYNINQSIEHIDKYKKDNNISFSFSLGNTKSNISKMSKMRNKCQFTGTDKKEYNILPEENVLNLPNIREYLIKKRKIDEGIIDYLIKKKYISADKNNNCLFFNEKRTFVSIKGISEYKYVSCAGEPDFIIYKNSTENLYLFESPIDALSFITLKDGSVDGMIVSTNGSMMINKIPKLFNEYNIKKIFACFDNDKQGELFCKTLTDKKINFIRLKPKYKDYNDDLFKQKNISSEMSIYKK